MPVEVKRYLEVREVGTVLHAFQKKTQKTSKQDIQIGQQRYIQMFHYRQEQQGRYSDEGR